MKAVKLIVLFIRNWVLIPLSILFDVLVFSYKSMLLGFDSGNNYLSQVSKPSIIFIIRLFGGSVGKDCDINTGINFHNCKSYRNLNIGNNVHIGKDCFFDLRGKITLADNVVVSMQSTFITHIDMTKSALSSSFPCRVGNIIVHTNSYIGVRSTVLMGVAIAENSFVAACSLVNKSNEPSEMIAGQPAKKIKSIG